MLILQRREGERITVGDGIEIIVIRASNGMARLGIKAPPQSDVALQMRDGDRHECVVSGVTLQFDCNESGPI